MANPSDIPVILHETAALDKAMSLKTLASCGKNNHAKSLHAKSSDAETGEKAEKAFPRKLKN